MISYINGNCVVRVFRNFDEMTAFFKDEMRNMSFAELDLLTEAACLCGTYEDVDAYLSKFSGDTTRIRFMLYSAIDAFKNFAFSYCDFYNRLDHCPKGVVRD